MPQDIVIVGAMSLGTKAACRFKRLEPESRVTVFDQDTHLYYDPWGIPYLISGDVSEPEQLQTTSFFMKRDENFFEKAKGFRVMAHRKVLAVDRENRSVHVEDLENGKQDTFKYDKLVLATGSLPKLPPFTPPELEGVFTPYHIKEARAVKAMLSEGKVGKAAVVGATVTGLETAVALADMWGIETNVIESAAEILSDSLNKDIARMARHHMEDKGISFHLSEHVKDLKGKGQVEGVVTDKGSLDTDLVIIAYGIEPNAVLARDAGLEISSRGAIVVNRHLQTSDPSIYAGGECVEVPNLITGNPGYFPSVSLSQRQGRIIGTNLAGGSDIFEGAVGCFITKLFEISVGGAGLTLENAINEGFDAVTAMVIQFDHAHYYPEKDLMVLEIVVDRESGRILGIGGLGDTGDGLAGRISAVSALLKYNPTLKDLSNMEWAYSPPFSSGMDIINALGNITENVIQGKNRGMGLEDFSDLWRSKESAEAFFLDCRGWGNAEPFVKKYPQHWNNIPQDELMERIKEIPKDRKVVLICNTGMRSYEAQILLDHLGRSDVYNLPGGMAGMKKWGLDL